jgi:hypothetical protein
VQAVIEFHRREDCSQIPQRRESKKWSAYRP